MKKIRQAVGAIINYENKYLMVHKVLNVSMKSSITGHWDFVKGGVEVDDEDLESAIYRELKEETGSDQYLINHVYDEKINFKFPLESKYKGQITTMFNVEYIGDGSDLKPQDKEIETLDFFTKEAVFQLNQLEETQHFLNNVKW